MSNIIKERIIDFQNEGSPNYIRREIDVHFIKDMVTTIVGGRKTGKTYLTYQIIDDLIKNKKIKSLNNVCYLHFDDEALMMLNIEQLMNVDKIFYSLLDTDEQYSTILFVFDEIHKIEGWENLVLRLQKKKNHLVLLTGSTSEIEEDKVGKQLRGKTFTFKLLPLSFNEFLKFNNFAGNIKRLSSRDSIEIQKLLDKFIKIGSYPAISDIKEKFHITLLQNYFNSVVAADFIFSRQISNAKSCKKYLKFLLQQNASPYSHKKLHNTLKYLGYTIGHNAISDWFEWSKECYLQGVCPIYSDSIKKIEQNYRKIYTIDWAMANSISARNEFTTTKNFESLIYWELIRKGYHVSYDIVGPDKYEIDFIVSKPNTRPHLAIQVSLNIDDINAQERELRGFTFLDQKLPNIEKLIITKDPLNRNIGIPTITAAEWLLTE